VRINIKINTYFILGSGLEFLLQVRDKFGYPAIIFIVLLTIAYEDVVFVSWYYAGHSGKELNRNLLL
jgi:hypothetical protein